MWTRLLPAGLYSPDYCWYPVRRVGVMRSGGCRDGLSYAGSLQKLNPGAGVESTAGPSHWGIRWWRSGDLNKGLCERLFGFWPCVHSAMESAGWLRILHSCYGVSWKCMTLSLSVVRKSLPLYTDGILSGADGRSASGTRSEVCPRKGRLPGRWGQLLRVRQPGVLSRKAGRREQ